MVRAQILAKIREGLLKRLESLRGSISENVNEINAQSSDMIDEASRSASAEINARLAAHESDEVASISRALNALDAGAYGICEVCQRKIPLERLQALPYSVMCVHCKAEWEKGDDDYETFKGSKSGEYHEPQTVEDSTDENLEDLLRDM